jgi:hypothetical protein
MEDFFMRRLFVGIAVILLLSGCVESADDPAPAKPAKAADNQTVDTRAEKISKVQVGKNVTLEVQGNKRRVLVDSTVCLREGMLEVLLCKKLTKEHESILFADIDVRDVHKALVLTGVEPGAPAEFDPVYKPATGPHIKVSLTYEKDGKTVTVPAQDWIRDFQKKKAITVDWVFAGSKLVPDPFDQTKPPLYLANFHGDVISVSNFDYSLLDISVRSSDSNAERGFEAFTERIPPLQTKVLVTLEPVAAEKPAKK